MSGFNQVRGGGGGGARGGGYNTGGGYRGGGRSNRGFRGGGRGGRGNTGGHRPAGVPMVGQGGEAFSLDVCKYFLGPQGCNKGNNCPHGHVITQLADNPVAPRDQAVNSILQWQEKNVFTATDEGVVKMWNTVNGTSWQEMNKVSFHERMRVGAIVESSGCLFCGYEGPFKLAQLDSATLATQRQRQPPLQTKRADPRAAGYQAAPPASPPPLTVGMLRVIQLSDGTQQEMVLQPEQMPYAHTQRINCLAVGVLGGVAAGFVLASGGEDGNICLWTPTAGGASFGLSATLLGHVRGITALLFVDKFLWSASKDHTIRVWDISQTGYPCVGIMGPAAGGHTGEVTCMVMLEGKDPDDTVTYGKSFVVSAGADASIKVWDATNGKAVYTQNSGITVTAMAAIKESPAGPVLLTGLENGAIALRDFPGFNLAFEINVEIFNTGHRRAVRSLTPLAISSSPSLFFISGADDGRMMVWNLTLPS